MKFIDEREMQEETEEMQRLMNRVDAIGGGIKLAQSFMLITGAVCLLIHFKVLSHNAGHFLFIFTVHSSYLHIVIGFFSRRVAGTHALWGIGIIAVLYGMTLYILQIH